ncbi:MAG TPA: Uma2 family endonuclease [Blastocatellia bacterium]|nr:Uma2 family endonuclease [Blastocatellia bacterium]
MSATLTLITADELLQMPDDGFRYELVKGELHRMPPTGGEHGKISLRLGSMIAWHVRQHKLGVTFAAETGFLIATDPDTVRAPDASFIRQDRIPESGIPKGYIPGAPDLAVEVISPNDIYSEVEAKVLEWLDAGTRMVIVVNPRKHTVTVYRSQTDITILRENDTLSGGDVLPGFSCKVAELFV